MAGEKLIIDNPKTIKAWTFYDWANSVFPLVITSAILPHMRIKNLLGTRLLFLEEILKIKTFTPLFMRLLYPLLF